MAFMEDRMKKIFVVYAVILALLLTTISCSTQSPSSSPSTAAKTSVPATTAAPVITTSAAPGTAAKTTVPATTTAPGTVAKTTVPATTSAAKYGGNLRFIQAQAPGSPMGWPPEATAPATYSQQGVFEYLLIENMDGVTYDPNLAESYTVNADLKNPSATFKIRKGVKFHDGTDLDANIVKWNLEQIKAGTTNVGTSSAWKSFEVIDDYTIKVNFTAFRNQYVRSFTTVATPMGSRAAFEKYGLDYVREHEFGTGPFKQVNYQRDVVYDTVKFNDYWQKGKPYVDKLTNIYVSDELTRVALFKSGGGEIMDVYGNVRLAADLVAAGYNVAAKVDQIDSLFPDSKNANSPWANQKVRMAAEYAIDKEGMARAFGYGYMNAAYQLPTPKSTFYDPTLTPRKYDPAKAKQLLKEAGYPNGFNTKIIMPQSGNRDQAVAMQSYLNAVGIKTELEVAAAAKFTAYRMTGWEGGLLWTGSAEFPNYNGVLHTFYSPTTAWYFSMKKPDDWVKVYDASTQAPAVDPKLVNACIRMLFDDCTFIPIDDRASVYAQQNYLHDAGLGTKGTTYYWYPENAWLSQ